MIALRDVAAIAAEYSLEILPAIRRIAEAEARRDLAAQAPAFQIVDRALRTFELLAVVLARLRQRIAERHGLRALLSLLLGRQPRAFARHGQSGRLRKLLDRLDVGQPAVLHQKADRTAVCAAAEAMVELLGRRDRKRRGFLRMERAQAHKVRAALFQLDVTADDIDDVDPVQQILNKGLRNHRRARANEKT